MFDEGKSGQGSAQCVCPPLKDDRLPLRLPRTWCDKKIIAV